MNHELWKFLTPHQDNDYIKQCVFRKILLVPTNLFEHNGHNSQSAFQYIKVYFGPFVGFTCSNHKVCTAPNIM